ncbi:hypothetical protein ACFT54_10205 [Streptomyces cinereoruber]|uniref:hypothetical protein n=1 Tax=Streptomyces cinereoruber TaxID=67260 RepID=UPI00362BD4EB
MTTCCSPSIASAALCRDDGTAVLLVVRSGCVECGEAAPDPTVVGWIDPITGVFTPGPAPADAGPCDTPGCIETICVTRCDDTDGDGEADTAYSELWCVRADGTSALVFTYSGDPSAPYVPVSPVECTYGTPESETVTLCDVRPDGTAVPFLRRYVFLNGSATFGDVALDGRTPHVVTGTVGVCSAGPDCESPTTPTAAVGLCLADGTPIAVVLTRDCDGITSQNGWVNLATGVFSAGDPPAGVGACGDSRAFDLTGVLCDTDPATGDVLGLVLVQYAYNPDGSLASVELIDPSTGDPYVLQGELLNCPAGTEQPDLDLVVLCDVLADGTAVTFLRDYRRDAASGQISGHTDYTLTGDAYAPAGTVGVCTPPTPELRDVELVPLCVLDNATGNVVQEILAEIVYDETGQRTGTRLVDRVTGDPVALPGGTHLGVCAEPAGCPCHIVELCLCDDTTGDGVGDTRYVELVAFDRAGERTVLGTYTPGYEPYTPVAPAPCEIFGADPAFGVQARRVELAAGQAWTAAAWPTLQSVTAVAHGGTATVTTADGLSTLHQGEAATWSLARETEARLTGPLVIAAGLGTVTVTFTVGGITL